MSKKDFCYSSEKRNVIPLKKEIIYSIRYCYIGLVWQKCSLLINYAVWESIEHYKEAVNKILFSSETQSSLLKYDDNLVVSPHLFKKVHVPRICVE